MAVTPRAELLDDPGGEPGRGVGEPVAERLRLGGLDLRAATLIGPPPPDLDGVVPFRGPP